MGATASFWDKFTSNRVTRRRALQMAAIGGASAGAIAVVGCTSGDGNDKTPAAGKSPTGPAGGGEGTPKPGGTLRGTVSLVLGKDPMKASTFLTHALASYSYSRLMRFKTTLGELPQEQWYVAEPEVASKVENPDPLTYVFTLRDDVKFHNVPPVNGRKLTADDVVYSFNRYRSISPNKGNLDMVDSVTASADEKQVTFKLKEPFGLFLEPHRVVPGPLDHAEGVHRVERDGERRPHARLGPVHLRQVRAERASSRGRRTPTTSRRTRAATRCRTSTRSTSRSSPTRTRCCRSSRRARSTRSRCRPS